MQQITTDTHPTGIESKIIYDPFDKAFESSEENGCEIISLSQNAESRIQQGKNAEISLEGNLVREGILYVPNGKNKFLPFSPILKFANEATNAHRAETEFYLTLRQAEPYSTDSIDFPEKSIEIPTYELNSEALTIHAFGGEDKAEVYGEFLYDAGIEDLPIYVVDKDYVDGQPLPFVRQLWIRPLKFRSGLLSFWGLHYPERMCVIKKEKPIKKQRRVFF